MNYEDIIRVLDGHGVPYKVYKCHNVPCIIYRERAQARFPFYPGTLIH